jgi:hypothetical protein
MSKEALIETIRHHNPSAGQQFLSRFTDLQLERYLTHLRHLAQPRSASAGWIRTFETRAIVVGEVR